MADDAAQPSDSPDPILYSVEEAASILGIGRTFMFHLLATGAIESFKIGKRRKVSREAINIYVNQLQSEQRSTVGRSK